MTRFSSAAWLSVVGLLLLCAGFGYGMTSVHVTDGPSCGNAFSSSSRSAFTSRGEEACAEARSDRLAVAVGLLVPGGVALVVGGFAGVYFGRLEDEPAQEQVTGA